MNPCTPESLHELIDPHGWYETGLSKYMSSPGGTKRLMIAKDTDNPNAISIYQMKDLLILAGIGVGSATFSNLISIDIFVP
jgi:hypothetical protein